MVGNFVAHGLQKANFGSQPVQQRLSGANGSIGPAQTKQAAEVNDQEDQAKVFTSIFHNEALSGAAFANRSCR